MKTSLTALLVLASGAAVAAQAPQFTTFGSGCPAPCIFYEQFVGAGTGDLTGQCCTYTLTASGYTVTAAGTFDPVFTNNLAATDDILIPTALGFTFPHYCGTTTDIEVGSNGFIGLELVSAGGSYGGTGVTETGASLATLSPRIAAWWDDLNPAAGGAVYADFKTSPNRMIITWDSVPQFGNTDVNTFQCQLFENGDIVLCHQAGCLDDAIVGYSGGNTAETTSIDLSATCPGRITLGTGLPLTVDSSTPALIGTTFTLDVSNVDAATLALAMNIGVTTASVSLDFLGMPGCTFYVPPVTSSTVTSTGTTGSLSLPIPNNPALICALLHFQAVGLAPGINQLGAYTSNGATCKIGGLTGGTTEIRSTGANSFNSDTTSGFFSITNNDQRKIEKVIFDWQASSNPAQATMVFDTDQIGMADRFDGGTLGTAGCLNTYRNGSAATVGLDFMGTDVACDATTTGWVGSNNPGTVAGNWRTLEFNFTNFCMGDVFEFDCDTDGGAGIGGDDMAGMVVTICFDDGSSVSGELIALGADMGGVNL